MALTGAFAVGEIALLTGAFAVDDPGVERPRVGDVAPGEGAEARVEPESCS